MKNQKISVEQSSENGEGSSEIAKTENQESDRTRATRNGHSEGVEMNGKTSFGEGSKAHFISHVHPSISSCINLMHKRRGEGQSSQKVSGDHANDKDNSVVTNTLSNIHNNGDEIQNGSCVNEPGTEHASGPEKGSLIGDKKHIQVLITGSIHLVGGALRVIWDKQDE